MLSQAQPARGSFPESAACDGLRLLAWQADAGARTDFIQQLPWYLVDES